MRGRRARGRILTSATSDESGAERGVIESVMQWKEILLEQRS
jgi:hypothetical protein